MHLNLETSGSFYCQSLPLDAEFLEMFRGELLDLKEILTYLELNPRHVSPDAPEGKLVQARNPML